MARKFTVMGFTEAELGFALAAFFVAVSAGYLHDRNRLEQHAEDIVAENARLRQRVDSLESYLAKRSNLIPPCSEKGQSDAPVASFRILDAERYEVAGVELTFDAVTERLSGVIAKSKTLGCRFSVEVKATEGVDAPQFSRATGRLRRLFYVRER
jgi:hypothetical protein